MRRSSLAIAVLTLIASDPVMAKGGYVRPPEPKLVHAGLPTVQLPRPDLGQVVRGCGPKRYLDGETRRCRGPADIGR